MKKIISASLAAIALTLLAACSDDTPFQPDIEPGIEQEDGYAVTSFSIAREHFALPDGKAEVEVALISADGTTFCFPAQVETIDPTSRLRMNIADGHDLPDGEYIMTMRSTGGSAIAGRLRVLFADRRLQRVSIILPAYMLDGSGTESDPYIIADSEDFEMFIINLGDDAESNGAGLFFRQTGDVTPSDQSSLTPGRGYWGAPFAGYYDGGGHEIRNLYYKGSGRESSDSGVGLFIELRGTASVSNLSFTGVNVSGLYGSSGILAGSAAGNISIAGVSLRGSFEGVSAGGGSGIGGLVGHFKSGKLTVEDISLSASVTGHDDVGGLIGLSEGETIVERISTPDYHFAVSGDNSVGGIIGRSTSTTSISDVHLEHKVTDEDSDLRIICGNGNGTGGVIGSFKSSGKDITLEDIRILCPVGGDHASMTGGVAGRIETTGKVTLRDARVYSIVAGADRVGGLVGSAKITSHNGAFRVVGDDLSTRVAADDAAAAVSGNSMVGGFAGEWEGVLSAESKVKINVPVTAGANYAGGVIGSLSSTTLQAESFLIGDAAASPGGDNVMKISGHDYVGGYVGGMTQSSITGSAKFDFAEGGQSIRVPDVSRFSSVFNCVVKGNDCVGGIAGIMKGNNGKTAGSSLRYLHVDGRIDGHHYLGGIVGKVEDSYGNCELEDCIFNGTLDSPLSDCVGGIAGWYYSASAGLMHDCVNYASISGADNTGGVVGYAERYPMLYNKGNDRLEIKWCVNMGKVSGSLHVGGIAGRVHCDDANTGYLSNDDFGVLLTACMNRGGVTGTGGSSNSASSGVGGIAGFTNFRIGITQCANHGDIYGSGAFHGIGGIAGSMGGDPTGAGLTNSFRNVQLSECCNTAVIDAGNSSSYVGGLLGYQEEGNKSDVQDCYNTGEVKPKQSHDCGGIVGCVDHMTNIYRCVNSGSVKHGNAAIGTHKSASLFDHGSLYYLDGTGKSWPSATKVSKENFTNQSKFGGLDFSKTWKMTSSGPQLQNCLWQSR